MPTKILNLAQEIMSGEQVEFACFTELTQDEREMLITVLRSEGFEMSLSFGGVK